MTRSRDWDNMFGGFDSLFKSVSRMHELSTGLRRDHTFDTLLKSVSGMSALSMAEASSRSFDSLLKSVSGMSALRMASESARGFDSLFESVRDMSALTKPFESARTLDSLFNNGVRDMSALRMASESTRAFDTLFKSMAHSLTLSNGFESAGALDSLFKSVSQMSTMPLAFQGARTLDSLFKSVAGLNEFGAAAAIAGVVGNFERDLTRAAVAAAALIEAAASDPEVLEEVREQSALVDLMTDMEVLAQSPADAEVREVMQQTGALLHALFAKHEAHRNAASSVMEKRAIEKVFKFAVSLLVSLIITYYAKCGLLNGKQASEITKQASEGGVQDTVALLSKAPTPELVQAEDLPTVREALDHLTANEESAKAADAQVYIVRRHARLLVNPSVKSTKVADLHPGQQVLLLQKKHKWIQIQYYNYLRGASVEGWVLKKYVFVVSTAF